jgi:tetratricopeptide (TPR) repeat protein
MPDDDPQAALAAETEGRFLDALRLVKERLARAPDDADAINLLGRLCEGGGDLASAIALQRLAVHLAPEHRLAGVDLARALAAIPDRRGGREAYDAAVARAPQIAIHHRVPGSLRPFPALAEVRELLCAALASDPSLALAHAALGNLLVREERFAEALVAYRRAIALEPGVAVFHLAAAELAYVLGDEPAANRHRGDALARGRLFEEPQHEGMQSILVLAADGPWPVNVPLDLIVDHERIALHRLYLGDAAPHAEKLPRFDLVFNAMSEYEAFGRQILAAQRFVDSATVPVINAPRRLADTARPRLREALRGVRGCLVPETRRCTRAEIELQSHPPFPVAVRPVDAHGGSGLARIESRAELDSYLAASSQERFDLTAFVDYRDPDGWYRKYRIIFVDGVGYPYHLAISRSWIVHYVSSAMTEHAWMRAEEERFLAAPQSVFPARIAQALASLFERHAGGG